MENKRIGVQSSWYGIHYCMSISECEYIHSDRILTNYRRNGVFELFRIDEVTRGIWNSYE